ncbi:hypothetical protein ACQRB4_07805, partial [Peptoniphilaceae bacterium SGI.097]
VITGSMKDGYTVTNTREPEKPKKESPKTGDSLNIKSYGTLFALSAALLVTIGFKKKKMNTK